VSDALAAALHRAGTAGRASAWITLANCLIDGSVTTFAPKKWPSKHKFGDSPWNGGTTLRCFAEAYALGDRRGALEFGLTSVACSEQSRRVALTMLEPLCADDPDGSATHVAGKVRLALGDREGAAQFQHRAAELGNADAMFALYEMWLRGHSSDEAAARRWLRAASEHGQASALFQLAAAHANGDGAPFDPAAAAALYARAADAGHPRAAATLHVMYRTGLEVPRDDAAAQRWLARARQLSRETGFDLDDYLEEFEDLYVMPE
jgi:hypothetical protein